MLVLSRKENEGIDVGANVRVVVVQIKGDKVRLGIEAPAEVVINRHEVTLAIARDGLKKKGTP